MLKITGSLDEPASSKNNSSKSAFNENNNSRSISKKNNNNNKVDGFDIGKNGMEHAKKSGKLFKSGKSKSKKTSKSWNLAKSGKKLLKSENSTNFDTIEAKPKFLTPDARTQFNCLRLAFTKALIL